ncbi:MAG: ATP-binding protein [Corynebacterium glutamicum]|nr:ATP-binding protein [Corynebacterium glutamicum]
MPRKPVLNSRTHHDVLVLDDFLTTPLSAETANILFNILAAREGRGSTLVTSQFNPEE